MTNRQDDFGHGCEMFVKILSENGIPNESGVKLFNAWVIYSPRLGTSIIPHPSQNIFKDYHISPDEILQHLLELTIIAFDFWPTREDYLPLCEKIPDDDKIQTVGELCFWIYELSKVKKQFSGLVQKIDTRNASLLTKSLWQSLLTVPNQYYSSAFAVKSFIDQNYFSCALNKQRSFFGVLYHIIQNVNRIPDDFFSSNNYSFRKCSDLHSHEFQVGQIIELRRNFSFFRNFFLFAEYPEYIPNYHYAIISSVSEQGQILLIEQKPRYACPPVQTDLLGFEEYVLREKYIKIYGTWCTK